jgi:hypothetical protein
VIVWDVVRTRYIPGMFGRGPTFVDRVTVGTFADGSEAIDRARAMNTRELLSDGIIHHVDRHDEQCPGRAPMPGEDRQPGACTCRTSPDAARAIGTWSVDTQTGRA